MGGIGSYDGDDVSVKGDDGSDGGVKINAIDDAGTKRLTVDAKFQAGSGIPIIPLENVIYTQDYALNGSNNNQMVDGSGTPVNFDVPGVNGEVWYVESVHFLTYDQGSVSLAKYGALSALSNGVEFSIKTNGVIRNTFVCQDNADVAISFTGVAGAQGNGGFAEDNAFWGAVVFNHPMPLVGSGDYVRTKIQDDLTGLDIQRTMVRMWRIP